MMILWLFWFGHKNFPLTKKYAGRNDACNHLARCSKVYGIGSQPNWVHIFCHTLHIIPTNWYLEMDLHHGTTKRDVLREWFLMTFNFGYGFESINEALQEVKQSFFGIP